MFVKLNYKKLLCFINKFREENGFHCDFHCELFFPSHILYIDIKKKYWYLNNSVLFVLILYNHFVHSIDQDLFSIFLNHLYKITFIFLYLCTINVITKAKLEISRRNPRQPNCLMNINIWLQTLLLRIWTETEEHVHMFHF